MGLGPYEIPNIHMDCYGAYTNNPPCGAMRGFGSVQAAFAIEAIMDKLADAVGLDPVEIRARNGFHEGSTAPTGQVIDSAAPVEELVRRLAAMPLPAPADADGAVDLRRMPGGVSNTTHGEGVRRGVGYAVAYKNVAFSEGFDDYSTARVRLGIAGGEPVVTVHTAAAEVGQGLVTVEQQICRTELGVDRVVVAPKDTQVGSAGSSSASRQTYVTGGAVKAACESVRRLVLTLAATRLGTETERAPARGRRRGRPIRRPASSAWPSCWGTTRSRTRSSGGTGRRTRSTRRPARASPTCSTPSPRTAPSSTSTSTSAW